MDSDMSELVVEEASISALALDWVHSNLYWASADRYNTVDSLHTIRNAIEYLQEKTNALFGPSISFSVKF